MPAIMRRASSLSWPSFTIMFELDGAESALRKILLGAAAPGGGRLAMIGGADAAFILSAETVSLLTKPVDDAAGQPAPAAKPQ